MFFSDSESVKRSLVKESSYYVCCSQSFKSEIYDSNYVVLILRDSTEECEVELELPFAVTVAVMGRFKLLADVLELIPDGPRGLV